MTEERPPAGGSKPRAPADQDLTGTGTPRSADDGLPQPGAASGADVDPAVLSGMTSTSQPASTDEVTMNRSGSGGSGPVEHDESVEGSGGQSMSEMLSGEEEPRPPSR
jgi:hypothetical protein